MIDCLYKIVVVHNLHLISNYNQYNPETIRRLKVIHLSHCQISDNRFQGLSPADPT